MATIAMATAFGADDDITDPTDWLNTPLACLMPVEQAFRCHVCKDFYNSPMITSCNHTFCSACIRRYLSAEGKCPLCRVTDQESKLRGNWALREAVDSFVKARPDMLETARGMGKAQVQAERSPTPKRKREEVAENRTPKRTRTSTRASKTRGAEATAAMMRQQREVIDLEHEDDYEPEPVEEPEPDDGLVACPICLTRMKEYAVSGHLDKACPGEPQPQPPKTRGGTTSKPFGAFGIQKTSKPETPPERLPSLNYSLLNDINLRKKMSALGISTIGSRQMLEQRHKEWVTIFNANCDSARPKGRAALQHELDVWERTLGTRAPTASRSLNHHAQIKDKNFDGGAWATKHGNDFKDLIAAASATRKKAQAAAAGTDKVLQRTGSQAEAASDQEVVLNVEPREEADIVMPPEAAEAVLTEPLEPSESDMVTIPSTPPELTDGVSEAQQAPDDAPPSSQPDFEKVGPVPDSFKAYI